MTSHQRGHSEGFADVIARYAIAAMLAHPNGPVLPFAPLDAGIPPHEGMARFTAHAQPHTLNLEEIASIDTEIWREAAEVQRRYYATHRALMLGH